MTEVKNSYEIDGIEVKLKSLSLREADKVNAMIKKAYQAQSDGITTNWTNEELAQFVSMITTPVDRTDAHIDYMNVHEETAAEIVRDFFLARIRKANAIGESLSGSMNGNGS